MAALCHPRIQATPEEVAKSLEGNWRAELLFALEQEVNNYDLYQCQMAACDQKLQIQLGSSPRLDAVVGRRTDKGVQHNALEGRGPALIELGKR